MALAFLWLAAVAIQYPYEQKSYTAILVRVVLRVKSGEGERGIEWEDVNEARDERDSAR